MTFHDPYRPHSMRRHGDDAAPPAPEPAKTEPAKTESTKTEAPKTEPAKKTESAKTEAPKTESAKTEAPKTESAKTEVPKNEPAKVEARKVEVKTEAPVPPPMYGPGSGAAPWREYAAATSNRDEDWESLSRGEIVELLKEDGIPTEAPSADKAEEPKASATAKPTS